MRILKYLLYALIALVVLFFAMGILKSSVSYGYEITVDKPLKEAWAVATDESKYAQWLEGFKSVELIEGEHNQPGSKYKVVVNPGEGQDEFEMIQTVISIREFEAAELHFDSEFMDFEQKYFYAESGGKTSIKTDNKVIGKNMVMRSMFAMMETLGGAFTTQEKKNMEALKKLINENTTDYFPAPVVSEGEASIAEEESE